MNNLNPQESENQTQNKYYKLTIFYLDSVIRGLIAFFSVGVLLTLILVVFLKMKFVWILPISFVVSILISPFLSRITLGERLLNGYTKWLEKTFNK